MRAFCIGLCVCLALCIFGCDEHDPDLSLIVDADWFLILKIGEIPVDNVEFPLFIRIEAHLESLALMTNAPDGALLVFHASKGTFENGLSEIEVATVNGDAEATLEMNEAGTYEISVEYGPEKASTTIVISTGNS